MLPSPVQRLLKSYFTNRAFFSLKLQMETVDNPDQVWVTCSVYNFSYHKRQTIDTVGIKVRQENDLVSPIT